MNDLIIVRQLPIIEEQLKLIKGEIEKKVSDALSTVCTDETVKAVKDMRAELNRDFNALEEKRKEVKSKVLSPYEQFEVIYKECVSQVFKSADQQLKVKIDEVENGLKELKKAEVLAYFKECVAATGVDFITFEQTGVTVTITASKKSLKDKTKAFVDKVADELALIDTQEFKAEILVEYKKSLNVAQSITNVSNRHKAIAAEREREAERKRIEESKAATVQRVEEVMEVQEPAVILAPEILQDERLPAEEAPIKVILQPDGSAVIFTTSFNVWGTKPKLRALKEFMEKEGIRYEQL